jgi:FKBP-type peptidyl-prolyl cis-trans isomerase (trigger factor)
MSDMYKRKNISDGQIELTITMPRDSFEKSYKALLKDRAKEKDIKGFRKGKVPEDLVEPSVKPLLQFETFEQLAPMYINTAIQKEEIKLIAPPKYAKLPEFEGKEDLEFKVNVTVMPDFTLGDLKKVKVKKESIEIKDEEVNQVLEELRKNNETETKKIGDKWAKEISKKIQLKDIKNLEDLKKMVKKTLEDQKKHMLLHKYQEDALKQAIELSKIEIPKEAIEFEANEREKSFQQEMQSRGVNMENFLKQSNLTIEKMREGWNKDAKEALETDVFLNLYADKKNIEVSKEELDKKVDMIKESYPDADKNVFTDKEWLNYIKRVERKEKAFKEFVKETLGDKFLDEYN